MTQSIAQHFINDVLQDISFKTVKVTRKFHPNAIAGKCADNSYNLSKNSAVVSGWILVKQPRTPFYTVSYHFWNCTLKGKYFDYTPMPANTTYTYLMSAEHTAKMLYTESINPTFEGLMPPSYLILEGSPLAIKVVDGTPGVKQNLNIARYTSAQKDEFINAYTGTITNYVDLGSIMLAGEAHE